MKEVFGDLWDFDGIIGITTNGFVKRDRTCVMGRGCAKQAAARIPELPCKLGSRISAEGNHVFYFPEYRLITFPVKHVWWEPADLNLIQQSARELLETIEKFKIREAIYLPRPGCGNGRLKWEDVKKILSPILKSDQFHIVTYLPAGVQASSRINP
ncbi:MAG: ADP-ribose-binding protein [Deltaproteobacteria bacterium]|nr:ADP-ribose-binding protein [Deltaproteobacteria bacterium]